MTPDHFETAIGALIRRLNFRNELPEEERDALRSAAARTRTFQAGHDLVEQHQKPDVSMLLADGMVARYSLLENGGRQITAFHILGDFVDLHGFLLSRLDYGISAMTDVTVVELPHVALSGSPSASPSHPDALAVDANRWRHLPAMADCHGAHGTLVLRALCPRQVVGLATDDIFPFSITQYQLADAMGMTSVHANRTLHELRSRFLLEWRGGTEDILDWKGLQRVDQFDDPFLDIEHRKRCRSEPSAIGRIDHPETGTRQLDVAA